MTTTQTLAGRAGILDAITEHRERRGDNTAFAALDERILRQHGAELETLMDLDENGDRPRDYARAGPSGPRTAWSM